MRRSVGMSGVLLLLLSMATGAQGLRPSEDAQPPERTIDELRFDAPTRIEGRLLILDTYDQAIWVQVTRVYDERRWLPVPHQVELLLHARDSAMMDFFSKLPIGTTLRMTIQYDQQRRRRILHLEGV